VRLNLRGRWQREVQAFVLLLPVRPLQDRLGICALMKPDERSQG
jgi:hypothetical protein